MQMQLMSIDSKLMESKEFIPIYTNEDGEKLVNARELWEKLEKPHGQFNKWFERMVKYGFEENVDFWTFGQKCPPYSDNNGRPLQDYTVTLNMAKELAMLVRNNIGKQVRKYFIEIERRYWDIMNSKINELEDKLELAISPEQETSPEWVYKSNIRVFIRNTVTRSFDAYVTCADLYDSYIQWSRRKNIMPETRKVFEVTLSDMGFQKGERKNRRAWLDLVIRG